MVIFREAQPRVVLDVPLWNALIVRGGSVLDIAKDHAQVILMQQASLLLRGFLLSHMALDYATENAAVDQASHFCHLIVFIELSSPVTHLEEFVNNDYY